MDPDPAVAPYRRQGENGLARRSWTPRRTRCILVWLGPAGYLHVHLSGADFPMRRVAIGCAPAGERSLDRRSATIEYGAGAEADPERVRAWSAPSVVTAAVSATTLSVIASTARGRFDVDRVVPDFATWSARILADRADAGLAVTLGEVRPYDAGRAARAARPRPTGPQVVRVATRTIRR